MEYLPLFWLSLNLIALVFNGFYSMLEMAAISFDKVRLQYYVAKGDKRVLWLSELLKNPSRLFGTTLIGVNLALVVGSECARQLFSSLDLSPDLAVIPQIILVILLGELAPMFAARRHPEHVVMLGIGFVWLSSKLLAPFLFIIEKLSLILHFLFGGKQSAKEAFLGRDELQKLLEVQDAPTHTVESEEFNHVISNIFSISEIHADEIMRPLDTIQMIGSKCTAYDLRELLYKSRQNFFPIFGASATTIVGVVYPRDLIRVPDRRRVRDYSKQPWFIDHKTKVITILKEFRTNNESLALVINKAGESIGYITLDHLLDFLFGSIEGPQEGRAMVLLDRTLSAQMSVEAVEKEFAIYLDAPKNLTLAELAKQRLGEHPTVGDSFSSGSYEITVTKALFGVQEVKLKTHSS